jgi:hypothetical protein
MFKGNVLQLIHLVHGVAILLCNPGPHQSGRDLMLKLRVGFLATRWDIGRLK